MQDANAFTSELFSTAKLGSLKLIFKDIFIGWNSYRELHKTCKSGGGWKFDSWSLGENMGQQHHDGRQLGLTICPSWLIHVGSHGSWRPSRQGARTCLPSFVDQMLTDCSSLGYDGRHDNSAPVMTAEKLYLLPVFAIFIILTRIDLQLTYIWNKHTIST